MLLDERILQVWCETQDDVTIIWQNVCLGDWVEFIQVKSNDLDQLWSVAEICKKEKSKSGVGQASSIIERSLAYDRCREPCRFRLVTLRPMNSELEVLGLPIGSPERAHAPSLASLKLEFAKRAGNFSSPNGRNCSHWADNALWDVRHSIDTIESRNRLALQTAIETDGEFLVSDQIAELYVKVLAVVRDAATERNDRSKKKLVRTQFIAWFRMAVQEAMHPGAAGGGANIRRKMLAAMIATDQIETALEEKRQYRLEVLTPQYLKLTERRKLEGEIRSKLQHLRAQLDAGELADDGPGFHANCLRTLDEVRRELTATMSPPTEIMQGFMYTLTDRCLHRFRRASA